MSEFLKKYRTSYLFSRPNFMVGFGSIFNISGNYFLFNYSKTDSRADATAIENDWGVIGLDIKNTINKYPKREIEFVK